MNTELKNSWWHTLPGLLTAIGGFITAIATLVTALYQAGIFEKQQIVVGPDIEVHDTTKPKERTVSDIFGAKK